ncbi:MAG: NAD(P)-binding protein, partial [Roseovarius sp.]|nr:NAD(P)-binding protein [Roseovarius sp.]
MDMDFDLVVAGGGIAGLVATAAFGRAGYSVLCIDPMPDPLCGGSEKTDLRTTALLQPSRNILEKIG